MTENIISTEWNGFIVYGALNYQLLMLRGTRTKDMVLLKELIEELKLVSQKLTKVREIMESWLNVITEGKMTID